MKKIRILSLLIVAVLLVGLLPLTAFATDDVYCAVGDCFAWGWNVNDAGNLVKQGDGSYQAVFTATSEREHAQLKIVRNGTDWIGEPNGENVSFTLTDSGDFTVAFDPSSNEITVYGAIVAPYFPNYETVCAVGAAAGNFLHGVSWDPAAPANTLTRVTPRVWEITYDNVDAGSYDFKFALNGGWTENFGVTGAPDLLSGVDFPAVYNGSSNIRFSVTEDHSTVKLRLDLTCFEYSGKEGATFSVTVNGKYEGPQVSELDEGFESGIPVSWKTEGDSAWTAGKGDSSESTGAHSGDRNAKVLHNITGSTYWLITPFLDLSGAVAATVSFWYVNRSWSGDIDEFGVYYRINGGDWRELSVDSSGNDDWKYSSVDLPDEAMTDSVEIGFAATDHYGYGVALDDVLLTVTHVHSMTPVASVPATCAAPGKAAYYHCEICGKDFEDEAGLTEIDDLANWGILPAYGVDFSDVSKKAWYYEAVSYAVDHGIFAGITKTTFQPNAPMTRAMFVATLSRMSGAEVDNNAKTKFSDVKTGQWYTGAVKWASDNGIVAGSNGRFMPNDPITREQICTLIVSYANFAKIKLTPNTAAVKFKDEKKISKWAKSAVAACQRAGLIAGSNGNFNPQGKASRAEVAQILMQFDKNFG